MMTLANMLARPPSPRQKCKSEPQMFAVVMRTTIAPASGSGTGNSRNSNGLPSFVNTIARPVSPTIVLLLRRQLHEVPRHDDALHLACSLDDVHRLDIAIQLLDIAVRAHAGV